MKVFDLHCEHGHVFEGWFGSEDDFQNQLQRLLIACPVCNSTEIHKGLSAPRLNLKSSAGSSTPTSKLAPGEQLKALQAAWIAMSRHALKHTEDVGEQFADEARRIHRGEVKERGIRGTTTVDEAAALIDEGIEIMPLALPAAGQETLQ